MKILARIICLSLCLSVLFCTIGCKKNNNTDNTSGDSHVSQSTNFESDDDIIMDSGNASSNQSTNQNLNNSNFGQTQEPTVSTPTGSWPSEEDVNNSSNNSSGSGNGNQSSTPPATITEPMSMLTFCVGMNKASLLRLIDEMSAAGVDALMFGVGGDTVLDDMAITTEYGTYTLNWFLEASRYTQKDLDEILAYAQSKNVEIIPTLQTPGHMGPFLSKKPEWRYPGTTNALDLTNPEACAYMHAAYKKYGEYFASRGCKYFSVSADEWGHEFDTDGYGYLYNNGQMNYFVDYMNTNIENLSNLGFEVMAWNDGIAFNNDVTTYGKIDNRLIVLYWTPGWGRKVASLDFLESQGYRIVNSFAEYYIESDSDLTERAEKISNFSFNIGEYTIKCPVGGMACVWGRPRDNDSGMTTVESMIPVLKALGSGVKNAFDVWKLVSADYSEVDAAISRAQKLNPGDYNNWPMVSAAIRAVVRSKKANEQPLVNSYAANINSALNNLVADSKYDYPITLGKTVPLSSVYREIGTGDIVYTMPGEYINNCSIFFDFEMKPSEVYSLSFDFKGDGKGAYGDWQLFATESNWDGKNINSSHNSFTLKHSNAVPRIDKKIEDFTDWGKINMVVYADELITSQYRYLALHNGTTDNGGSLLKNFKITKINPSDKYLYPIAASIASKISVENGDIIFGQFGSTDPSLMYTYTNSYGRIFFLFDYKINANRTYKITFDYRGKNRSDTGLIPYFGVANPDNIGYLQDPTSFVRSVSANVPNSLNGWTKVTLEVKGSDLLKDAPDGANYLILHMGGMISGASFKNLSITTTW